MQISALTIVDASQNFLLANQRAIANQATGIG
jgi:hypothetical protein